MKPTLPLPADTDAVLPDDLSPLLSEPFAQAWAAPAPAASSARSKLADRLARSAAREAGMHTTRLRRAAPEALADGVSARRLYTAAADRPLRRGEPQRVRLLELAPGAMLPALTGLPGAALECLVMAGSACLAGHELALRDYLRLPATAAAPLQAGPGGARLFVREAPARPGESMRLVRDGEAGWPAYGVGIRRRVLWADGDEAALLYQVDPGAFVPLHTHGHDEECLMLEGELFLDDVLMQAGDYQVAPMGTQHALTRAETAGVLFAHGDVELQFIAGET
jgi:quercetin dioxygenase-like cupin family protein